MSKSFRNVVRNNLHVKAKYIAQIVSHDIMSMTMFRMVIRLFAKNTLPRRLCCFAVLHLFRQADKASFGGCVCVFVYDSLNGNLRAPSLLSSL